MKFYSDWACRIAAGTWTDHQAFYGMPGYAYWLALIYTVFGFQPYIAALLQVIAEAFTALLIFKLAPLAFAAPGEPSPADARRTHAVGWLAAMGWVLCVPAQAYSTILMPTAYLGHGVLVRRVVGAPAADGAAGRGRVFFCSA